jgi:hypothetical protein
MPKVRFIRAHNGYQPGEELDVDNGVADALITWAKAAELVTAPPELPPLDETRHDKMMRPKGGKQLVRTK